MRVCVYVCGCGCSIHFTLGLQLAYNGLRTAFVCVWVKVLEWVSVHRSTLHKFYFSSLMLCNTLQVQFYSQLNIEANVFIGQSTSSPGKGIDSKGKIQFRDNYVYTPSRLVTLISNLASHIVQKYLSKCAFHLAVTGSNPKHTIYAFLIYGLFYHIRHCN